jgi:hypothetical protein
MWLILSAATSNWLLKLMAELIPRNMNGEGYRVIRLQNDDAMAGMEGALETIRAAARTSHHAR